MNLILIGLISICGNFMPNGMAKNLNEGLSIVAGICFLIFIHFDHRKIKCLKHFFSNTV
jgi:hypothetical protein